MRVLAIAALLALPACGVDKVLHAGVGFGVGVVTDEFIGDYGCEAAIAIGIAKELIDPIFSIPDVVATATYCLLPRLNV